MTLLQIFTVKISVRGASHVMAVFLLDIQVVELDVTVVGRGRAMRVGGR